MPEPIGPVQRPIAPESPAVQRARRKAQKEQTVNAAITKTAEAIKAIQARQSHNPHDKVGTEIHREAESTDIKALKATLAAELHSEDQERIESIAARRFGG